MTDKERYYEWAATQEAMPVFMQPWWMEAVCAGKNWDVLLIERDGDIIAAMPYMWRKRLWMRYTLMPQLTQIGGMWVDPRFASKEYADSISDEVAQRLATLGINYYYQQFPRHSLLPHHLQQRGFVIHERVTYRLEDLSDMQEIERHFSKNKRRQLQRAQSLNLTVDDALDAESFYRFHVHCLLEQHKQISYSREFLLVLERKTARLRQSRFLAVRDPQGQLHAAAFLVWDKHSLYYLIPCFSPAHKDSGAGALLVLSAIQLARELGLAFDFEGSMRRSIANHYRQFGSVPVLYYGVERYYSRWFKLATWLNRLRNLRYRL